MIFVFYTVHVALSLFLILVVLLQQGKGADLSVFGGGASQAAFGARGAATLLHKLTVVCFVLFIMTTLSINIVQKQSTSSVMSGMEAAADNAEADDEPEAAADDATATPVTMDEAAPEDSAPPAEGEAAGESAGEAAAEDQNGNPG